MLSAEPHPGPEPGPRSADGAGHLLVISYHFGEHGATGGFRWFRTLEDLGRDGWTADVLTATEPDPSRTLPGVRVHVVAPVTWPARLGDGVLALGGRVARTIRGWVRGGRNGDAPEEPAATPRRTPHEVTATERAELRARAEALWVWRPGFRVPLPTRILQGWVTSIDLAQQWLWSRRMHREGARIVRARRPDVVVCSGPPHVPYLGAAHVSRKASAPLVLDYRDPWVVGTDEIRTYLPTVYRWVGRALEPRVQRSATVVVHNTEQAMLRARSCSPPLPDVTRVAIANGYDVVTDSDPPADREHFRIAFGGWLHPYMDIRFVLRAAGALGEKRPDFARALRIELIGTGGHFAGMPFEELAAAYGLDDRVEVLPRMSRAEAQSRLRRAAMLLAFDYPYPLAVVMKAYDYLQMPGALLFIGEPGSALDQVGSAVGSPAVQPGDDAALEQRLSEAFDSWRTDGSRNSHDPERRFHRSARSREVADLLSTLLPAQGPQGGTPGRA